LRPIITFYKALHPTAPHIERLRVIRYALWQNVPNNCVSTQPRSERDMDAMKTGHKISDKNGHRPAGTPQFTATCSPPARGPNRVVTGGRFGRDSWMFVRHTHGPRRQSCVNDFVAFLLSKSLLPVLG
jgi:hypothetical protein